VRGRKRQCTATTSCDAFTYKANDSKADSSCEVGVTFKPTATGARNATLSILDTAAGSPHPVALSGSGKKSGR
jgi:hypothetical protein